MKPTLFKQLWSPLMRVQTLRPAIFPQIALLQPTISARTFGRKTKVPQSAEEKRQAAQEKKDAATSSSQAQPSSSSSGQADGHAIKSEVYYIIKAVENEAEGQDYQVRLAMFIDHLDKIEVDELPTREIESNLAFLMGIFKEIGHSFEGSQKISPVGLKNIVRFWYLLNNDDASSWASLFDHVLNKQHQWRSTGVKGILQEQKEIDNLIKLLQKPEQMKELILAQNQNLVNPLNQAVLTLGSQIKEGAEKIQTMAEDLYTLDDKDLIKLFNFCIDHVNPQESSSTIFEFIDDQLSQRVSEKSISYTDVSEAMMLLASHNGICPQGFEINLELFITEAEDFIREHWAHLSKKEYIEVAAGFATSGFYPDISEDVKLAIEQQLKQRVFTLTMDEAIFLLKTFSQMQAGSTDGFYRVLERFIASNSTGLNSDELYTIIKSFSEASKLRHDLNLTKFFLKMQRQIIAQMDKTDANKICSILRLYSELQITSSTVFEQGAKEVESRLNEVNQQGFIDIMIALKSQGEASVIKSFQSDLEGILASNIGSFNVDSLAQLFISFADPETLNMSVPKGKKEQTIFTIFDRFKEVLKMIYNMDEGERGQGHYLNADTLIGLFACLRQISELDFQRFVSRSIDPTQSVSDFQAGLFLLLVPQIIENSKYYDYQITRSFLEHISMLASENHGFEEARIHLKDQISLMTQSERAEEDKSDY